MKGFRRGPSWGEGSDPRDEPEGRGGVSPKMEHLMRLQLAFDLA